MSGRVLWITGLSGVPDLAGCIATGLNLEEIQTHIREAIQFHLEGLRQDGLPITEPTSRVNYIDIAA